MRNLMKIMLLAVLALPFCSAFAGPVNTLEVDISVSVNVAVDITFFDGTNPALTPQAWDLTGSTLGSSPSSSPAIVTDIKNNSGADVNITVQLQPLPLGFKWSVGPAATKDDFNIVSQVGLSSTPVPLFPAPAAQIIPVIAAGGAFTTNNTLTFNVPQSVSHVDPRANPGDVLVVLYVGTVN